MSNGHIYFVIVHVSVNNFVHSINLVCSAVLAVLICDILIDLPPGIDNTNLVASPTNWTSSVLCKWCTKEMRME